MLDYNIMKEKFFYSKEDVCVLIATMNKTYEQCVDLVNTMKIRCSFIVVNQCGVDEEHVLENKSKIVFSSKTGLSNSRNLAIASCQNEICLVADDDIVLSENYLENILEAYNDTDSDIIIFDFETNDKVRVCKPLANNKTNVNLLKSLKVDSVRMTFKRSVFILNKITFDTLFGAGAFFNSGEENILLKQCIDKGIKIYYYPVAICFVDFSESTWFNGYNSKYFETKGAFSYAVFGRFYFIYMMQFIIRKHKLYKNQTSCFTAIKWMLKGKNQYIELNNERISFHNNPNI